MHISWSHCLIKCGSISICYIFYINKIYSLNYLNLFNILGFWGFGVDPEDKKRYNREHRTKKREEQLTISINSCIPHGNVEWRDIVDYEGLYIISNFGMIRM